MPRANKISGQLGQAQAANSQLWKYADGMNLYQLVGSDPVTGTDPSGLDRYITGCNGHHGIAVDTWTIVGGKWQKTGVAQYDYSADYRWTPLLLGAWCGCPGRLSGPGPGFSCPAIATIPSSPQADNVLKANLDAAVINPPIYNVFIHNCNNFVMRHMMDGINVPPSIQNSFP